MKKSRIILAMLLGSALLLGGCKKEKEESKPAESPAETSQSSQSSTLPPLPVGQVRVVFHDGDRIHATIEGYPGDPLRKPSNPARLGSAFRGWSETERGRTVPLPTTLPDHSMDFYAIFNAEVYYLTFQDHPDFDGAYGYGDDLPTLEGDLFHAFLGWYISTGDNTDSFFTVPDLGDDGEEVTLIANQDAHQLHIQFMLPPLYDAIEEIVTGNLTASLPSIANAETGKVFQGWSLITETDSYGVYEEGKFCVSSITEIADITDHIERDETGEMYLTLYPVFRNKVYHISLYSPDGSAIGSLSTATDYAYGAILPNFEDYAAVASTVGYAGMAGWSTARTGSQSASNTFLNVPDLGADGASVSLYANLRSQTYKIYFGRISSEGLYANGESEFVSEGLYAGDLVPEITTNAGWRFSGYEIQEAKEYTLLKPGDPIPNLADRTLFDEPTGENGAYVFLPEFEKLRFPISQNVYSADTMNIPNNLNSEHYRFAASMLYSARAGDTLRAGEGYAKNASRVTVSIGDNLAVFLGHTISAVELWGSADRTTWTRVKSYDAGTRCVIDGIYDTEAFRAYTTFKFKFIWTEVTQSYNLSVNGQTFTMKWEYGASYNSSNPRFYNGTKAVSWTTVASALGGTYKNYGIRYTYKTVTNGVLGSEETTEWLVYYSTLMQKTVEPPTSWRSSFLAAVGTEATLSYKVITTVWVSPY